VCVYFDVAVDVGGIPTLLMILLWFFQMLIFSFCPFFLTNASLIQKQDIGPRNERELM